MVQTPGDCHSYVVSRFSSFPAPLPPPSPYRKSFCPPPRALYILKLTTRNWHMTTGGRRRYYVYHACVATCCTVSLQHAATQVEEGDIVYITHAGFAEDGRQIDANVKDELFKVTIGTRMVLQVSLATFVRSVCRVLFVSSVSFCCAPSIL